MATKSGAEIATGILSMFNEDSIKEIIEKLPWMNEVTFTLLTKQIEVEQYVDKLIKQGICALDIESTGLNTRKDREGNPWDKIVGICLASSPIDGVYIPVAHEDKEYNVNITAVMREVKRLCENCKCIFHNFKFDGQFLRNYGIIIEDDTAYEDTYLMMAIFDASRKTKGLKDLSEHYLKRPMLEIDSMGVEGAGEKAFFLVPPPKALYYAASDAVCTFGLYNFFTEKINEQDPEGRNGPWAVYRLEKMCLFATMDIERNYSKIDRPYLMKIRQEIAKRSEKTMELIYETAGRKFDISSPKQLGIVLFDELKIPYPEKEKTASGQYKTDNKILEKLASKYPLVDMISTYRSYCKVQSTYVDNLLNNADWNDEVRFQLNQVQADTGRFSSSGGKGLVADGYCGVNCQNMPRSDDENPDALDIRGAIVGRPGTKIATIDYSGEELRIATNFSHEEKWVNEFLRGTGDLHTITAQIIYGKEQVTKKERGIAKTLNFLTLYGGGAGGFAAQAKIPYETAKKMIINFFKDYRGLKGWIDAEAKRSKRRGFSKTCLGRRRPLADYYNSPDEKIRAKGDRCAVNAAVQGSGADIIKLAMYRVWKWIHTNNFQDDIRMLMPVHDEIVFEIKEDKLDFFIPELCNIMKLKDVVEKLGWVVPLEVDAEYGDSFHVDHDYFKELKAQKKDPALIQNPTPVTEGEEVKKNDVEEKPVETVEVPQNNDTIRQTINTDAEKQGDDIKKVFDSVNIEKEESPDSPVFQDARIKDRIDKQGYFVYSLNVDPITVRQLKVLLEMLTSCGDKVFIGPTAKLCLINSRNGEVWYRSTRVIPIDAFVALCLWLNI